MGIVPSKLKADRLFEGVEIYLNKHISGLRNIMCKICRKESIAYLSSLKKCGVPRVSVTFGQPCQRYRRENQVGNFVFSTVYMVMEIMRVFGNKKRTQEKSVNIQRWEKKGSIQMRQRYQKDRKQTGEYSILYTKKQIFKERFL